MAAPSEVFARADELIAMGLDVPQMTHVFMKLKELGIPVDTSVYTVQQAMQQLVGMKRGEG